MGFLIPSIDISGGFAVKRVRGVRGSELVKLSIDDALNLVKDYPLVHVVDLDGAEAGEPINLDAVKKIGQFLGGRCEVGGGLRSIKAIGLALDYCTRAVLGTVAFENTRLLEEAIRVFGQDKVAVSVDVSGGWVVTRGWGFRAMRLEEALGKLPKVGVVIYTNVDVEGTGKGPLVDRNVLTMLRRYGDEVYYAGGVSGCDDVERLWGMGFDGVIVGYAIYVRRVRCGG